MLSKTRRFASLSLVLVVLMALGVVVGCASSQPEPQKPVQPAAPAAKEQAPQPVAKQEEPKPAPKEQAAPPNAPAAQQAAPVKEEVVKLGMPPLPYWLSVFLADEKGYFAEQKLKVEYVVSQATSVELMAAVARGDIEVLLNGLNAQTFNMLAQGFDVKMVASAQSYAPGYFSTVIMLRKDVYDSGEIRKPEDLKGRSVSFSIKGAQVDYVIRKLLEKAKLTEKDVKASWPVKGTQDYFLVFANKAAEVEAASEPTASQIVREGLGIKWFEGADLIPEHDVANVLYAGKFMKDKPDAAKKFMVAYLKGQREAQKMGNKWTPEMVKLVAKFTKMQEADIQAMKVPYLRPDLKMSLASLNDQQNTWFSLGLVTEKADLPKFVDYSYVDYAMKTLGQ